MSDEPTIIDDEIFREECRKRLVERQPSIEKDRAERLKKQIARGLTAIQIALENSESDRQVEEALRELQAHCKMSKSEQAQFCVWDGAACVYRDENGNVAPSLCAPIHLHVRD